MVAIVSGNELGLTNDPLAPRGDANLGRPAQSDQVYVNARTGNLVIQRRDEYLAAVGPDLSLVRTYNSLGRFADDNGDNWRLSAVRRLVVTGTPNTGTSTVKKTFGDGAELTYVYDAGQALYISTAGDGAHDTLSYNNVTQRWTWTDGSTRAGETYDVNGQLLSSFDSERDASGNPVNVTSYTYTGSLLTQIVDASGQTTFLDYVGNNLSQIRIVPSPQMPTLPTQTLIRYGYDASNRLQTVTVDLSPEDNSVTDGKIYKTTYTYDGASKRVASITDTDGSTLSFTYELQSNGEYWVKTYTDGEGKVTTFAYGAGQTDVTDALGLVTTFITDTEGRISEVRSPGLGGATGTRLSTFYQYDGAGNLTQVTDGNGGITTYTPDQNGNITRMRDAQGNIVDRTYNSSNRLLTETRYLTPDTGSGPAQPLTARYVYDAESHLRFVISADGRVTEYRYDGPGNRIAAINYREGFYVWSGAASEAQMTTWVGTQDKTKTDRTDYGYDFRGDVSTITTYANVAADGTGVPDAGRTVTYFVYDQRGRLLQTIDARGAAPNATTPNPSQSYATTYVYDGLGRVMSETQWIDGTTRTTLTVYDDTARKVTVTLARGLATARVYDKRGLLLSVSQSDPHGDADPANDIDFGKTRYQYDADGRLRVVTDPLGNQTHTLYDEADRPVATIDATGAIVETVYDSAGNAIKQIRYVNAAVNLASLLDASGNPANVALASVRPGTNAGDRVTRNIYDAANRLVFTFENSDVSPLVGFVTAYVYDGVGRLTDTIRYGAGIYLPISPVRQTPSDLAAKVAAIADPLKDRRTRSLYDADGKLRGTLDGEGGLCEYVYDAAGHMTQVIHYATAVPEGARAAGTVELLRGNISSADDDQHTYNFYNASGQIIATLDAERYLTEYAYDSAGNRTQETRYATPTAAYNGQSLAELRPTTTNKDQAKTTTYNGANQVTQVTENPINAVTVYTYDAAGRLIRTDRSGFATGARYDAKGRFVGELTGQGVAALAALGAGASQSAIDQIWRDYGLTHVYDLADRRISTTDQLQHQTLFYYDADGRLRYTINPLGEVTQTIYNNFGDVQETISYGTRLGDLSGLTGGVVTQDLISRVNAIKNVDLDSDEKNSYTRRGLLSAETTAISGTDGSTTSYSYNAFKQIAKETLPANVGSTNVPSTDYTYDRRGLATVTTRDSADGGLKIGNTSDYDAFGRMVRSTDGNGTERRYQYDRLGRQVATTTDPNGVNLGTRTTYDAFARVLTQTVVRSRAAGDPIDEVTTYSWDDLYRSYTVTPPGASQSGATITSISPLRQPILVFKPDQSMLFHQYDANGNEIMLAEGHGFFQTLSTYDRANRLIESTDANGVVTRYEYDAANRLISRTVDPRADAADTDHLNLVTSYAYDAKGQLTQATDPNGQVTAYTYDLKGEKLTVTVDPNGLQLTTLYTYDKRGNTLTVTEGANTDDARKTQYVYDNLDRLVQKITDPDGATALKLTCVYAYDANGNLVSTTEGTGAETRVTRNVYDSANRLIYTLDATGAVVQKAYDRAGNVTVAIRYAKAIALPGAGVTDVGAYIQSALAANLALADPNNAVTRYAYDGQNRLVFTIDPLHAITENQYDAGGNMVRQTRYANPLPSTGSPTFASDALSVETIYGLINNPSVFARDAQHDQTTRTYYDLISRPIYRMDALGYVTQNIYDSNSNVVTRVAYATAIASPDTAWSFGQLQYQMQFSPLDRYTRTVYDAANRPIYAIDAYYNVTETVYNGAGQVAATIRYASAIPSTTPMTVHDIAAVIADQADTTRDQITLYQYDGAGRLVQTTDAEGASEYYDYDSLGNKIAFTNKKGAYALDPAYTWKYEYDKLGRLTKETTPSVVVTRLTANADGSVTPATINESIVTAITYDTRGNVRTRTEAYESAADARTTTYVYDLADRQIQTVFPAVGVYDASADRAANYVGRNEAVQTPTSTTYYNALGQAIASKDVRGNYSYKAYDQLGRVAYEIDAERFVTAYTYDAFGNQLTMTRYATALADTTFSARETSATSTTIQAFSAADMQTLVGTIAKPSVDRTIVNVYDLLNRTSETRQPAAYSYDSSFGNGLQYFTASPTTRNAYNAFGQLIEQSSLKNPGVDGVLGGSDDQWIDSYFYYDVRGNKRAQIDPGRYLTEYRYDAAGNLIQQTEYAAALAAGSFSTAGYGAAPTPSADGSIGFDRITRYGYDWLNRKIDETKVGVQYSNATYGGIATLTSQQGDLTTHFGYDALGNIVSVTDPSGAATYTTYDVLGRTRAIAEPARTNAVTGDTTVKIPVTAFQRDAFGNVTVQYKLANGATSANSTAIVYSAFDSTNDQITYSFYDTHGQVLRSVDAEGKSTFNSYDAAGNVVKQWHTLTNADGQAQQVTQLFSYDRLGHQVATSTSVSSGTMPISEVPSVVAVTFNNQTTSSATSATSGANSVTETFASLTAWGPLQATLYYIDSTGDLGPPRTASVSNGVVGTSRVSFIWSGDVLKQVDHFVLTKQVGDQTVTIYNSATPAASLPYSRILSWNVGDVPDSAVSLTYQPSDGSAPAITVSTTNGSIQNTADHFLPTGNNYFVDISAVAPSKTINYQINYLLPGATHPYATQNGTFTNSNGASGVVSTASSFKPAFDVKQVHYNAFGDIDKKGLNGGWQEYFDYDAAGRLWRTNQDDGVDKVMLYNLQGQATSKIQSQTFDLHSLTTASDVLTVASPERTDRLYDALGRVTQEIRPSFTSTIQPDSIDQTPTVAAFTATPAPITRSSFSSLASFGTNDAIVHSNAITINWSPPDPWGGSDGIVATLYYSGITTSGGTAQPQTKTSTSSVYNAAPAGSIFVQFVNGFEFSWNSDVIATNSTFRLVITKQIGSQTLTLYDSTATTPLVYSRVLSWQMTVPDTDVTFKYTPSTAGAPTTVLTVGNGITLTGSTAIVDLSAFSSDPSITYSYTLEYRRHGDRAPYQTASGTFTNVSGNQPTMAAGATVASTTVKPRVVQTFDRWGNLLSVRDPRSQTNVTPFVWITSYRYDYANHLIQQIAPATDIWTDSGTDLRADSITTNDRPTTYYYFDAAGRALATTDPNGNTNANRYDEAGQVVGEYHADGGMVKNSYDLFGRKTVSADPDATAATSGPHVTTYRYDRNNRLLEQITPVGVSDTSSPPTQGTLRYSYDEDGNRTTSTVTGGATDTVETTKYFYDADGNVLLTRLPESSAGAFTDDTFDAFGHKVAETNGVHDYQTWTYDYFGHLLSSRDLGGGVTAYQYDEAGRITDQTRSGGVNDGQNLHYDYFENGALKRIVDTGTDYTPGAPAESKVNRETDYEYDAAGNRIRERYAEIGSGGAVYQDTRSFYDELNRLSGIHDRHTDSDTASDTDTRYFYDAAGNRRRTFASFLMQPGITTSKTVQDYWYTYDRMNRVLVSKGNLLGGAITIATRVVIDLTGSGGIITSPNYLGASLSYDAAGNRTAATFYDKPGSNPTSETYTYDGLNRLYQTYRFDTSNVPVITSSRLYDIAGRVAMYQLFDSKGNASETRTYTYNLNGWLLTEKKTGGSTINSEYNKADSYDAAGNLMHYVVKVDTTAKYEYTYQPYIKLATYRENIIKGVLTLTSDPSHPTSGLSTSTYDANGNLINVDDKRKKSNTRAFIVNPQGQILRKIQNSHAQTYYYAAGQQVGSAGLVDQATFDYNYTPISQDYPALSPTSYVVNDGDTLQGIALAVYGDASLWFLIADANGIPTDTDLADHVNQVITIPNRVTNIHNNAGTVKVYNPKEIIGSTLPTIPPPPPPKDGGNCGGILSILVSIVAAILSVFTWGQSLWLNVLVSAAISAASNLATQGIQVAFGMQQGINWGAVAVAGITGGALGALGGVGGVAKFILGNGANPVLAGAINGVANNAISQGINIVAGQQKQFNWVSVAAAGIVGAGMGYAATTKLGKEFNLDKTPEDPRPFNGGELVARTVLGIASGAITQAMSNRGKIDWVSVAADSFGNALGNSIVGQMKYAGWDVKITNFGKNIVDEAKSLVGLDTLSTLPDLIPPLNRAYNPVADELEAYQRRNREIGLPNSESPSEDTPSPQQQAAKEKLLNAVDQWQQSGSISADDAAEAKAAIRRGQTTSILSRLLGDKAGKVKTFVALPPGAETDSRFDGLGDYLMGGAIIEEKRSEFFHVVKQRGIDLTAALGGIRTGDEEAVHIATEVAEKTSSLVLAVSNPTDSVGYDLLQSAAQVLTGFRDPLSAELDRTITDALAADRNGLLSVIGHSQGTIVAVDVLGSLDPYQRAKIDYTSIATATPWVPAGLHSYEGFVNAADIVPAISFGFTTARVGIYSLLSRSYMDYGVRPMFFIGPNGDNHGFDQYLKSPSVVNRIQESGL